MDENLNKKYFTLSTDFREESLIDKEKLNQAENEFIKLNERIKLSYKFEPNTFIETYSTLISNISKIESVSTSQIEGSPITVREFQERLSRTRSKNKYSIRIKESLNNVKTIKEIPELIEKFGFGIKTIKEIHKLLFSNLSDEVIKGKIGQFKRNNNVIINNETREKIYFPPDWNDVLNQMKSLLEFFNKETSSIKQAIINSGIIHAWFERIHPFSDGNGRVGRIIIPFYFTNLKLVEYPFVLLSSGFKRSHREYYRSLVTIQENGNYKEWLDFYINVFYSCIKKLNDFFDEIVDYRNKVKSQLLKSNMTFIKINSGLLSRIVTKRNMFTLSYIEKRLIEAKKNNFIDKIPGKNGLVNIMNELYLLMNLKEICKNPKVYLINDYPKFQ